MIRRTVSCACGGGCPRCQAKSSLNVSPPNDPAEREADAVAEQVMRMPEQDVQGQWAACDAGGPLRPSGEERETVSRKAEVGPVAGVPASVDSVLHSPGAPLSASTRAFFEARFGEDLSHVRVHTDGMAWRSAREVNALAYTVGSHAVFGAGQYEPGTSQRQRLLAHELTHVLQQGRHPSLLDLQRTADSDLSGPCDRHHVDDLIDPAFAEARRWRRAASVWLEAHLDHIRAGAASPGADSWG